MAEKKPTKANALLKKGLLGAGKPAESQHLAAVAVDLSTAENIPGAELVAEDGRRVVNLPLQVIDPNPLPQRSAYDESDLQAIQDSIAREGQREPIHVRPHPKASGRYIAVDGWTRWQAKSRLGQETIWAVIDTQVDSDLAGYWFGYRQNEERRPLSDLDKSLMWNQMVEQGLCTAADIAREAGIDKSLVSRIMAIARLPQPVLDVFRENPKRLTYNHATELVAIARDHGEAAAEQLVAKVLESDMSVKELQRNRSRLDNKPSQDSKVEHKWHRRIEFDRATVRGYGNKIEIKVEKLDDEEYAMLMAELDNLLETRLKKLNDHQKESIE